MGLKTKISESTKYNNGSYKNLSSFLYKIVSCP